MYMNCYRREETYVCVQYASRSSRYFYLLNILSLGGYKYLKI